MSSKNVAKKVLATAADLSASYSSPATDVSYQDVIGYIVETTGVSANTGTFKVQARCVDFSTQAAGTSGWVDLTLSSTPTLANADASFGIDILKFPWDQIRLVFTPGGGGPNGTARIQITTKRMGG